MRKIDRLRLISPLEPQKGRWVCQTLYVPDVIKHRHPIIALHGMWATNARWHNYARFFCEQGFVFLAPNLRHHYPDNNLPELGRASVNDYVDDLKKLIQNLDPYDVEMRDLKGSLPKPIIIGHSMGGLIAQKIAEAGLAKKLILLNSAPPAGVNLHADLAYQLAILRYLPWVLFEKPFKPSLAMYARFIMNGMPKDQHEQLYEGVICESGRAAKEIRFGKIPVDFEKITCPTLVVGCEKDRITPIEVAKEIHSRLKCPHVYWKYTQFAHWIQVEPGWKKPAQDIANWLIQK